MSIKDAIDLALKFASLIVAIIALVVAILALD
ncbi:putative holin-like toxin [Lacticaseibacillus sharpeae]|nr:putative holin-like toxin [Lacticaseibacillus sharpeae]